MEFGLGFQENWTPFEGRQIKIIVGKKRLSEKEKASIPVLAVPDIFLVSDRRKLLTSKAMASSDIEGWALAWSKFG